MRTMTKKILSIAAMLSFTLCGYAQKGEKGIGANLSVPILGDAGVHFKLEYMKNITDRYRIIPYVSMNEDPAFFLGIDNHFLILKDVSSLLNPYLNVGIGFFLTDFDYDYTIYGKALEQYPEFSPYLTLGAGIDYQTSEKWTWQAEIGVNMHTTSFVHAYLSVGVTYTIPERENRNANRFIPIYIPYNIGTNVGTGVGAGAGSISTGTSTTIQTEKRCHLCAGTGICTTCNGRGQMINSYTGQYQDCPNCHAPLEGKCHSCGGTGRK